jgi:hypothetical protein
MVPSDDAEIVPPADDPPRAADEAPHMTPLKYAAAFAAMLAASTAASRAAISLERRS